MEPGTEGRAGLACPGLDTGLTTGYKRCLWVVGMNCVHPTFCPSAHSTHPSFIVATMRVFSLLSMVATAAVVYAQSATVVIGNIQALTTKVRL